MRRPSGVMAAVGMGALAGLALGTRALVRRMRYLPVEGRTVLITGGTRGLGVLMARECARRGARVAVCARDGAELAGVQQEFAWIGGDFIALRCDVRDQTQVEETVAAVERRLGPVEVLINNAGVIQVGPEETITDEDMEESLRVHVWGPWWMMRAVLPEMKRRGRGRIVNVASVGGKVAVPHLLAYSTGKFALVGMSEGLRAELLEHGVYVTTVCPFTMRTGSPPQAWFKGQHEKEYAWFAIFDSWPGTSVSAQRAARMIIDAAERGQAELLVGPQAKAATWVHGLMPGLVSEVNSLMHAMLPGPGGVGRERRKGYESESKWTRHGVTRMGRQAEVRNREHAGANVE